MPASATKRTPLHGPPRNKRGVASRRVCGGRRRPLPPSCEWDSLGGQARDTRDGRTAGVRPSLGLATPIGAKRSAAREPRGQSVRHLNDKKAPVVSDQTSGTRSEIRAGPGCLFFRQAARLDPLPPGGRPARASHPPQQPQKAEVQQPGGGARGTAAGRARRGRRRCGSAGRAAPRSRGGRSRRPSAAQVCRVDRSAGADEAVLAEDLCPPATVGACARGRETIS